MRRPSSARLAAFDPCGFGFWWVQLQGERDPDGASHACASGALICRFIEAQQSARDSFDVGHHVQRGQRLARARRPRSFAARLALRLLARTFWRDFMIAPIAHRIAWLADLLAATLSRRPSVRSARRASSGISLKD